MWVGTQNGLNRFDPKTSKFAVYTTRDGLAGNAVGCILDDGRGALWMSTTDGISRFDTARSTFRNYSPEDGLPGRDLTGWGACYKSPTGEMFFGGFSGGVSFFPETLIENSYSPRVVLTDFRLFGKPVEIGPGSFLKKSITYASGLTLSHEQSVFSLEFSALNHSTTTRYRYRLDGMDRQWNDGGRGQRIVTYNALPAREYRFHVQASNHRGEWNEVGLSLPIEILPPWWDQTWFRAAYSLLTLLVLWQVYTYRLRQIARQFELRLEERVSERTRIARELHDTLLQGFQGLMFRLQAVRDLLPERASEAVPVLETALDRGDQAIAAGRDAVQGLRSSIVADDDLVPKLTALAEELGTSKANPTAATFRLLVDGQPQVLAPILQDEIYLIAREALGNAFRHAHAQKIEAEITYGARLFRLRIRDDGRGIDRSVLDRGSRAGHWGLTGMRERAKAVGGKLDVWSQDGAGTEVDLTIPSTAAYRPFPGRGRFSSLRRRDKKREQ